MFSKWFEPWKDPSNQEPMEMRSVYHQTVLQTNQGDDGTCYAHLTARLIIQNLLKLKDEEKHSKQWKYGSTCRKMLKTYKPPSPTLELKQCGENGYLKMSMFLYLYYLIIEKFGMDGGLVHRSLEIYPSLLHKHRPQHFTEPYDNMYSTVSHYLQHPPPLFQCNYVELDESAYVDKPKSLDDPLYDNLVQLIFLFLQHNMYVGCRFYMLNDITMGHLFMITGYSSSKKAFYMKNTWGTFVSMLKLKDIGKNMYGFETQSYKVRINLFIFVYPRSTPLRFFKVTPEILHTFKRELRDSTVSRSRSRKRSKA